MARILGVNQAAVQGDQMEGGPCDPPAFRGATEGVSNMALAIASILGSADTAQYRTLGRPFGAIGQALAAFWRELARDAVRPYRPEQHYMRGPGPAWRAKYGTLRAGNLAD